MIIEKYWMWLVNIDDMHNDKIRHILSVFLNPKELFCATEERLRKSKVITDIDIERIINTRRQFSYEKYKYNLDKQNIKFLSIDNNEYPNRLKRIYNPPYALFVKGKIIDSNRPAVAIIGARNCTLYGKKIAENISDVFGINKISVVSGMARGIDTCAHRGALKNDGYTYAVLGCGVDICYPRENINIFSEIQKKGGIISEYPPGIEALKWHFPARNRIISGLADAVIIVEAKKRSGSLITVEYALEQGKDVYAVPGRIDDELSKGCNSIIKAGAEPFLSAEEVVLELKNKYFENSKILKKEKYPIAKDFEVVYSVLDLCPKNINTIIEETELASEEILGKLVQLQLLNLVDEPIKGYYSRKQ